MRYLRVKDVPDVERTRVLRFKDERLIPIRADGPYLTAEITALGVLAAGRTPVELEIDLWDEVIEQWVGIAEERDDVLTPQALNLKRRLRDEIEEVAK